MRDLGAGHSAARRTAADAHRAVRNWGHLLLKSRVGKIFPPRLGIVGHDSAHFAQDLGLYVGLPPTTPYHVQLRWQQLYSARTVILRLIENYRSLASYRPGAGGGSAPVSPIFFERNLAVVLAEELRNRL